MTTELERCRRCDATLAPQALWCSLCYAATAEAPEPSAPEPSAPEPSAPEQELVPPPKARHARRPAPATTSTVDAQPSGARELEGSVIEQMFAELAVQERPGRPLPQLPHLPGPVLVVIVSVGITTVLIGLATLIGLAF